MVLQYFCLYCGSAFERSPRSRGGEHVIQDALNGKDRIPNVCSECNNGELSALDNEFTRQSPLSMVAGHILGKELFQTWDVDENDGRILLEARPQWANRSMQLYPQLLLDGSGMQLRGDLDEVQQAGAERFGSVFTQLLRRALNDYQSGVKGRFHFENLSDGPRFDGYSFPPRVYARTTIEELNQDTRFIIRYIQDDDRRRLLNAISNLEPLGRFRHLTSSMGSYLPCLRFFFSQEKVARAILKNGLNLVSRFCERTFVSCESFREPVDRVMGRRPTLPGHVAESGFIHAPADNLGMIVNESSHSFRLQYDRATRKWNVLSAYFGGKIWTYAAFHGRNNEPWNRIDIQYPVFPPANVRPNKLASFTTSQLLLRAEVTIDWEYFSKVIPYAEIVNEHPTLRQIPQKPSRRRSKSATS